jgi:hypothetical protein
VSHRLWVARCPGTIRALVHALLPIPRVGEGWVFPTLMDALIAEAASRGHVGLELVSADSTIVRAHHESAGLAIAGETLDALEQALTEEKGAPLPGAGTGAAGGRSPAEPDAGDTDTTTGQDRAATRGRRAARAKQAKLGRSRGGLSSKIHAVVDAAG